MAHSGTKNRVEGLDPAPPLHVRRYGDSLAMRPAGHSGQRKFATMRTLSDVLAEAVGGFRAPGVNTVIRRTGAGDEEVSVGVQPKQLFEIGSITKTMTALLVLQHVQQAQIDLDDPISAYLPA